MGQKLFFQVLGRKLGLKGRILIAFSKMQVARVVELVCDLSDIIEDIADKIQIMLITRKALGTDDADLSFVGSGPFYGLVSRHQ